jgi:PII interaction protein X
MLMNAETYLNHPTFGLLFRVCMVEEGQELFTTLYAQRLFFLVATTPNGIAFEPISRSDARLLVENRLRLLRRTGSSTDFEQLQLVHQQTFQ